MRHPAEQDHPKHPDRAAHRVHRSPSPSIGRANVYLKPKTLRRFSHSGRRGVLIESDAQRNGHNAHATLPTQDYIAWHRSRILNPAQSNKACGCPRHNA